MQYPVGVGHRMECQFDWRVALVLAGYKEDFATGHSLELLKRNVFCPTILLEPARKLAHQAVTGICFIAENAHYAYKPGQGQFICDAIIGCCRVHTGRKTQMPRFCFIFFGRNHPE